MTKYTRETAVDISDVNRELSKIETAISMALNRYGASPNQMEADLDMNSNDILNAGSIGTDTLAIGGVQVVPNGVLEVDLPSQTGNAGKYLQTNGTTPSWAEIASLDHINIDDYVTDDDNAAADIQVAADLAKSTEKALVSFDTSRTYSLESMIDLTDIRHIYMRCRFQTGQIDGTAVPSPEDRNGYPSYWNNCCILLGGFSGKRNVQWVFEGNIMSSNTGGEEEIPVRPQVSINGAKSGLIRFADVDYLRFYQEEDGGPPQLRSSCAYNRIQLNGLVRVFEVTGDYRAGYDAYPNQTDNPNYVLWWNENYVHNGRIQRLWIRDRGYSNNHNHFVNNNFENTFAEIRIENGSQNYFTGQRFENARSVWKVIAATQGNPMQVTTLTANNINVGDEVYMYNFGVGGQGMGELEGQWCTVLSVVDDSTFTVDIDSSLFSAYTYNSGEAFQPQVLKPTVYFGEKCHMNVVERTWVSSILPSAETGTPFVYTGVRDLGLGNQWSHTKNKNTTKHPVLRFNGDGLNLVADTEAVPYSSSATTDTRLLQASPIEREGFGNNRPFTPGLRYTHFDTAFTPIGQSALLPVEKGDTFSLWTRCYAGGVRVACYLYDEGGQPLTVPADSQAANLSPFDPDAYLYSTAMNWVAADNAFAVESDIDGEYINSDDKFSAVSFTIANEAVKFIRIALQSGNNTNTILDYAHVYYHEKPQMNNALVSRLDAQHGDLYLDSVPTKGSAPIGTVVSTPLGDYQCEASMWCRLDSGSDITAGGTAISVDITSNSPPFDTDIRAGDVIGILLTNGLTHWTTVSGSVASAAGSTTFTISDGLASPDGTTATAKDGAPVWIGRWDKKDNNLVYTRTYSGTATNIEAPNHKNVYLECTNAAGCTLTLQRYVADGLPVGSVVRFQQADATGTVTVAAGTLTTIKGPTATTAQYDVLTCIKYDENEWHTHL